MSFVVSSVLFRHLILPIQCVVVPIQISWKNKYLRRCAKVMMPWRWGKLLCWGAIAWCCSKCARSQLSMHNYPPGYLPSSIGFNQIKKFKRAQQQLSVLFSCVSRMAFAHTHGFITRAFSLTPYVWPRVSRTPAVSRRYKGYFARVSPARSTASLHPSPSRAAIDRSLCNRAFAICIIILMVFRVPVSNNFLSTALYVYIMRAQHHELYSRNYWCFWQCPFKCLLMSYVGIAQRVIVQCILLNPREDGGPPITPTYLPYIHSLCTQTLIPIIWLFNVSIKELFLLYFLTLNTSATLWTNNGQGD